MIDALTRDLIAGLGLDPDDSATVLGLASLGVTTIAWKNGPLEDWREAPDSRITDPELMRTNAATTRAVHHVLCTALLGRHPRVDSPIDPHAGVFRKVRLVIADPNRRLPDGRTIVDIAPGPEHLADFDAYTGAAVGRWTALARDHGPGSVVRLLAYVVGKYSYAWWLTPWWPARVDAFVRRLKDPRRWETPEECRHVRRLRPPPDAADHDRLARQLLAGPDRLSAAAAAYCLSAGLGIRWLTPRPPVDRHLYANVTHLLEPDMPSHSRAEATEAQFSHRP